MSNDPDRDADQRLHAIRLPIGAIDDALAGEMYRLFRPYYANVSPARFVCDLRAKDSAILLRRQRTLAGFTSLKTFRFIFEGVERLIVFSGDTIVARAHWGEQALARAWIAELGRIAAAQPGLPLYWFLIVKGHRTYRYMPTFAYRFVPGWAQADEAELLRLREAIATAMFGDAYDAASGVIRFTEPQGNLAPDWSQPSARERGRADVAFFLARNPGFGRGDELACLCEITEANMRPLTRRLFRRGLTS